MMINGILFNDDLATVINELKSQLTIAQIPLLSSIKDTPDNLMISCPYHKNGQESRPSAGIRKSDGQFHCFACGEVHTLQEVISYCFGHTNDMIGAFGWNWLLKNFLTVEVADRKDISLSFERRYLGKPMVDYISETELDSYRYFHPYMYKRKLTDEVIEMFDIGYDKKTDCITFPVRDISGGTLFIARRSVKTKYFNYPSGVEKPIYGIYEINEYAKDADEIIICESMLDALYFWTIGKYAVALNGLGDDKQFLQLRNMPCRKFILCTDSDYYGMKARDTIRKALYNKVVKQYILPEGRKDANDCTLDELKNLKEIF